MFTYNTYNQVRGPNIWNVRDCWIPPGLQGQTIQGVRTIQESHHDVGIGSPVGKGSEQRSPEPVLAQLDLHIPGG